MARRRARDFSLLTIEKNLATQQNADTDESTALTLVVVLLHCRRDACKGSQKVSKRVLNWKKIILKKFKMLSITNMLNWIDVVFPMWYSMKTRNGQPPYRFLETGDRHLSRLQTTYFIIIIFILSLSSIFIVKSTNV
jgi:hypothetical protein